MNDKRYGVIKNIQDAQYGGRRAYVDLHTPDYAKLCAIAGVAACAGLRTCPSCRASLPRRCSTRAVRCWRSTCCRSALQDCIRRPAGRQARPIPALDPSVGVERAPEDAAMRIALIGCGRHRHFAARTGAGRCRCSTSWPSSCPRNSVTSRAPQCSAWRRQAQLVHAVPAQGIDLVVDAAGHGAIEQNVLPALGAVCRPSWLRSVRFLLPACPSKLEAAARAGSTQVQLIAGAIGAIDALAAARIGGLETVRYTGRKPPQAWEGTPGRRRPRSGALTGGDGDL